MIPADLHRRLAAHELYVCGVHVRSSVDGAPIVALDPPGANALVEHLDRGVPLSDAVALARREWLERSARPAMVAGGLR